MTPTNPQADKPLNPITGEPLPTHKEIVDAIADYQGCLGLPTPISNTEQLDDFIAEIACLYSGFQPNNYWKRAIVEQHPDAHKTARTKLEVLLATHTAEAVATVLNRLLEQQDYIDMDNGGNEFAPIESILAVPVEAIQAELNKVKGDT